MELLKREEREELIDLLCELPEIGQSNTRRSLVTTLPVDLRNSIEYNGPLKSCIASIVDTVISDAWFQLDDDDTYPILVVIQNAMYMVRRAKLEAKLLILMNKLRGRLKLPLLGIPHPKPPSPPLANYMREVDDLINLLPTLENELKSISNSFNSPIYQLDCKDEKDHLTGACLLVRKFSTYLIQSVDLPHEVVPLRFGLMNALKGFDKQAEEVEKSIGTFCADYGAERDQPVEERRKVQQQLNSLMQCCKLVLDEAETLRSILGR